MELKWTAAAMSDLARSHAFLAPVNSKAAAKILQSLAAARDRLLEHPRLGRKVGAFAQLEIRRIFVGPYERRYQIQGSTITVLRLWHTREHR